MRLPLPPPQWDSLLRNATPEVMGKLFSNRSPVVDGKYLHWDKLRHLPPPEGLTPEQWWAATKIARSGLLQPIPPLLDKRGRPFQLAMPEPVLIHLHHIDRDAAGRIKSAAEVATSQRRDRYLVNSLMEEAIASSQLEGASTTRKVAEAMLREGRKPRDHSERMIFNNYRTMQAIRTLGTEPITPAMILKLHRLLTDGTLDDPADAGRLRLTDDIHVVHPDGTSLHVPPPHAELPARLDRLCAFANAPQESAPFVHPVLRAILLHFMIGYDHPFADGNGRTARALFYWAMARSGYWLMEFLSISHFLRRAPSQYVRAYLHTESDDNDTTYFVLHQLNIIRRALAALHDYLSRAADEQRSTERLLATSPRLRSQLNHRQVALLTHALKHPGEPYRVEAHQHTHSVVYQTARTDLLKLADLGLLTKTKSGKAFVFLAPEDLHLRITGLA